jgi:GNAT superfamily N-acetyltransferase
MSDAVGVLETWDDGVLKVRRKDGTVVEITQDTLVAGKVVPPAPARARTHSAVGVHELEQVAALGWQAAETERLGDWLLRASGGWTGRANSVLPLGDPGMPVDGAIARVVEWYAARGLPPCFQVPLPLAAKLDARLADAGWLAPEEVRDVLVLTGDVATVLDGPATIRATDAALPRVRLSPAPGPGWLSTYRYRGGPLPAAALDVLTRASAPVFAEVVADGVTLAVGRGAVEAGWIGITAMDTAPEARRRGFGRHVLTALIAHGRRAGAEHVYLQCSADNAPAVGLYSSLGLTEHHRYHYRVAAAGAAL